MLIALSASARNIVLATPAWLRMPTPTTLILATFGIGQHFGEADLRLRLGQRRLRARQVGLADGEGHVGRAVGRDVLHDHVDIDVVLGQRAEHRRGDARAGPAPGAA